MASYASSNCSLSFEDDDDENAWVTKVTSLKIKDKLIEFHFYSFMKFSKIRGTTVD